MYRFFYAAQKGNEVIVKLLIDAGADISIKNNIKDTAYKIAEEEGYESICKLLKMPSFVNF